MPIFPPSPNLLMSGRMIYVPSGRGKFCRALCTIDPRRTGNVHPSNIAKQRSQYDLLDHRAPAEPMDLQNRPGNVLRRHEPLFLYTG